MTGYDPSSWSDFGVAQAGASAALTGLLFVANAFLMKYMNLVAGELAPIPFLVAGGLLAAGRGRHQRLGADGGDCPMIHRMVARLSG